MNPDEAFLDAALEHDFPVDEPIKIGGAYTPILIDAGCAYIAGQIPRVGDSVRYIGTVGSDLTFEEARRAAAISTLRALALIRAATGTLATVSSIPKMAVYVRSAPDFTQHSEVADGASNVLHAVFAERGVHTRTSLGVLQLPKGAAVEIDFIFRLNSAAL
jgi:enamine deaminase RidA (YjgF/YER057c/UK114 family)